MKFRNLKVRQTEPEVNWIIKRVKLMNVVKNQFWRITSYCTEFYPFNSTKIMII